MITISQILKYLKVSGRELSPQESKTLNSIFANCDTQKGNGQNITDSNDKKGDGFLNFAEWEKFKELLINKGIQYLTHFIKKTDEDFNLDNNADKAQKDFDYFAPNSTLKYENFRIEKLKQSFPNSTIKEFEYNGSHIINIKNPDGSYLERETKNNTTDQISYSINGEDTVVLNYKFGKLTYKEDLNKNRVIYYNSEGKIFKIENNDTTYFLDENEEIIEETSYEFYDKKNRINYQDNEIKSYTNYDTGERTEALDNNTYKTVYDGNALFQLFQYGKMNLEEIKKLSNEEKLEFLHNFDMSSLARNYSSENKNLIKNVLDFQIDIVKEHGGYTEDLKALSAELQKNINHNYTNHAESLLNSFKTHLLERIDSIKNPKKDIEIKGPNGKIDTHFKQGNTGDCWLLATIKTIANHPNGLDKLNKKIKIKRENGELISVTVNIQGKDYEISKKELDSATEYSTGDLDVRAIEIAVNRFCIENGYKDITAGGGVDFGIEILFGNSESIKQANNTNWNANSETLISSDFIEELNNNKIGVLGGAYKNKYAIDVETGEKIKLIENHAYSISSSDEKYIYIINPHDSSKTLKIEKENISSIFTRGKLYEI